MSLKPPSKALKTLQLPTTAVQVSSLYRISRFESGEPFFGKAAANRFDDPSRSRPARFGTCYFGFDTLTAISETLLHDEVARAGKFPLSYAEFASRHLHRFSGGELTVADLTGVALKTLGGDGSISTIMPYQLPQRWARAVHRHPQHVDGILYMSRHLNDRKALVVFDRARDRFHQPSSCQALPAVARIVEDIATLHISFDYP